MSLTSAPIEKFITVLKRSGLLDDSAYEKAWSQYQEQDENPNAEAFATFLSENEYITSWHAAKLLKGKHKGFFLGKYKLLRLLGRGGMSSVYLAEHIVMKRLTAIKVLPYKLVKNSSYLERFYREAQAVAALDDPNIVRAYDVDHETDGEMEIHFLVMEYVRGQNFYELVKGQGVLDPRTAADYIRQGAMGLQHAHDVGMVHRDVKPGNFLVDTNGTVKLMDLGLARINPENEEFSVTLLNEEKILGTADYLAPEQAVDSHHVDSRADIYALGCTFYFILTGQPPFDEGTLTQRLLAHQTKVPQPIRELQEDIPESLCEIIDRMMIKDVDQRTQTASKVAKELEQWLADQDEIDEESGKHHHPIIIQEAPPRTADDDQDGAIDSFLSQLEEKSAQSLSQSGSDAPSKKKKPPSSLNFQHPSDSTTSVFHSEPSSILRQGSRRSSRRIKRHSQTINKILYLGIMTTAIIAGIATLYVLTQKTNENELGSDQPVVTPEHVPSPPSLPKISGSTIHVGPAGDFKLVGEALSYLVALASTGEEVTITEIRIAADQTLEETISIDNSNFRSFPATLRITGEGPKFPVIKGSGQPVLSLDSIEKITISNLSIDCAGTPVGAELTGYLSGTRLVNLKFINISETGLLARGASGLAGRPVTLSRCRFETTKEDATAVRFTGSESLNSNQLSISGCRFIGPMAKGIVFSGAQGSTWDVTIEQSIFHKVRSAITFAGEEHDISRVKIANNTFHEFTRGINFETGPNESCREITFIQNLFAAGDGYEVSTARPNVSLKELVGSAIAPQSNWTTGGARKDSETWLNIFENNGKTEAGKIDFASTDPNAADFLKPQGDTLRSAVKAPVDGRNYIGAVAP